jgi:hypothetical protein
MSRAETDSTSARHRSAILPGLASAALTSLAFISLTFATPVAAQHLDVRVDTSNGPVAGSKITTDVYGDVAWFLANVGSLPYTHDTGRLIVPGNFGDAAGGPFSTDNPGFQSFRNDFGAFEEMSFRAIGTLQYMAPGASDWVAAAPGGGIRLYGSIPDDIVFDYVYNELRGDEYAFYEAGTFFTGAGIQGPASAPIGAASALGAMHYHLDWYLEGTARNNTGAYLIEMQLFSSATSGGAEKYLPSDTFHILFNHGITTAQYADALKTLTVAPVVEAPITVSPVVVSVPEPASVAMLALGGALLAGQVARRRRKV